MSGNCFAMTVGVQTTGIGTWEFSVYFSVNEDLCNCKNQERLFSAAGVYHDPTQQRLFIDSSIKRLEAVLLHSGNIYPSISLAYSLQMKEDHENVKQLLIKISYAQFKWYVCGDFKMVEFLLGLQSGFTKYSCFGFCGIVELTVSTRKFHWLTCDELTPGMYNVIRESLVSREQVLMPPLYIKLSLVQQFVKALASEVFQETRLMFPRLSDCCMQ